MSIWVRPARVAAWLSGVVAVLTLLSILSLYVRFGLGRRTVAGLDLVGILHLDADVSIPGWYSAAALLLAAVIVAAVARATALRGGRGALHWAFLAAALCYLSVDETARLHEQSAGVLAFLFDRDRFLTRSWTVPAAIAALLFAGLYVPFLLRLAKWQRVRLVAAGGLFVFGAAGLEVVGHYVVRRRLSHEEYGVVPYQTVVHVEEVMEMAAVVLLIYAVLRQLESLVGEIRLRLSPPTAPAAGSEGG